MSFWAITHQRIQKWVEANQRTILVIVTLGILVPFISKPFNMDDPLFLWTAAQIRIHPLDPFGFNVNWYGTESPMWTVTQNPPLTSYYIALVTKLFNWSETTLHGAFLAPAIAVVLGTYRLAANVCRKPFIATLITLLTPVFAISSNTVMCDVMMLALWVWSIVLWIEGIKNKSSVRLAAASLVVSLASLTKYFGVCLVPLLLVYAFFVGRSAWRSAVYLIFPLFCLAGYHWITSRIYHQGLLWGAGKYAIERSGFSSGSPVLSFFTALAFVGGCLAPFALLAPWMLTMRDPAAVRERSPIRSDSILLWVLGTVAILMCGLVCEQKLMREYDWVQGGSVGIQVLFWAFCGMALLCMTISEMRRRTDAFSWMLCFWIFGTFLFTAFFNWTINGRSILPMAPAVGILIARRLEPAENAPFNNLTMAGVTLSMVLSAILAVGALWADFKFARSGQQSAQRIHDLFGDGKARVWFQGHWGFQYYMAKYGARALNAKKPDVQVGDILAIPVNNTDTEYPDQATMGIRTEGQRGISVMSRDSGAAFYSSVFGPLPIAFGAVPAEKTLIVRLKP